MSRPILRGSIARTQIPVVHERDVLAGKSTFGLIPNDATNSGGYRQRHTLRIYDFDSRGDMRVSVRMRFASWLSRGVIAEQTIAIDQRDANDISYPYFVEADLERLDDLVDQMRARADHGHVPADVDQAFHQALFEPLGNPFVLQLIDVFWSIFRRASDHIVLDLRRPTAEDHAAIVDALRSGDRTAMTDAVARHFEDLQRSLDSDASQRS